MGPRNVDWLHRATRGSIAGIAAYRLRPCARRTSRAWEAGLGRPGHRGTRRGLNERSPNVEESWRRGSIAMAPETPKPARRQRQWKWAALRRRTGAALPVDKYRCGRRGRMAPVALGKVSREHAGHVTSERDKPCRTWCCETRMCRCWRSTSAMSKSSTSLVAERGTVHQHESRRKSPWVRRGGSACSVADARQRSRASSSRE